MDKNASRICLCLTAATLEENLRAIEQYKSYIQLAELRSDLLEKSEWPKVKAFSNRCSVPLILTCRLPQDGGAYNGPEAARTDFLASALKGRFAFLDLEEDNLDSGLEALAAGSGTRIIRSFHDFEGTPADLPQRLEKLFSREGEIPKAAVTARGTADLLSLYSASSQFANNEKILLAMGNAGFPSRILAARFGSYLTYSSPSSGRQAASGHADPQTMEEIYRFSSITSQTPVFGIIGSPVMHSQSPRIHNAWFAEHQSDAVYCPFETDDVNQFFRLAESWDIGGFSVTIPHKQAVIQNLDEADASVSAIHACNTVYKTPTGWKGTNTDKDGFIQPLLEALHCKDLKGRKATVIGAGGAARACIFALQEAGAEILVINRTYSKASALSDEFHCRAAALEEPSLPLIKEYSDLIIQTTNIGMGDGLDPLPFYEFSGKEVLYDIIYTPPVTPIMARSEQKGCRVLGGYGMLEAQAKKQFKIFLNVLQSR